MKRLHISNAHRSLGAQLVEYAGWEMPLSYTGLADEHMAVRNAAGIFDASHMGEFSVRGPKALDLIQDVVTNDASKLAVGGVQYATITNERGGTKDDIFIYRLGESDYMIVCNASNVEKIGSWLKGNNKAGAEVNDITMTTTLFAVQGPKALSALQGLTDFELGKMKRFKAAWVDLGGVISLISRTGYTGEDGFEVFLMNEPMASPKRAEKLWMSILNSGKKYGLKSCGLGARDTLRLEAGLCLYGNELTEEISPLEARIEYAVSLEKGSFIGLDVLREQKKSGVKKVRAGFTMLEPGIPRHGYGIFKGDAKVGEVTSGTFSPLLKVGIAMGYVPPEIKAGETVSIEIHEKKRAAKVAEWPFYNSSLYGHKRK